KKQLISGIHFNYMLSDNFLNALFSDEKEEERNKKQEALLMKLAKNFLRHKWVLTYLFGASPIEENKELAHSLQKKTACKTAVRSLRNSPEGYPKSKKVNVSHDSFASYVSDIEELVNEGVLQEEREYYGAVRLRGKDEIGDILTDGL